MSPTAARELLVSGTQSLERAGIESARLDARLLLAHAMGVRGDAVLASGGVGPYQRQTFQTLIARRAAREPLAYITGTKEFWSLDFEVGPGVLVPRPETETLVEEAFRAFPSRTAGLKVLDLGTGSGCLLIAFLSAFRNAQGEGVDVSAEALSWARRNVIRHGLSQSATLRQGSWNGGEQGRFDVLLVNPPYLSEDELDRSPPEIARYEPREAFAAGVDGLDCYRSLAGVVGRSLTGRGLAFVEAGAGQADAAARIFEAGGLEVVRVAPDLSSIPRCVVLGRRG